MAQLRVVHVRNVAEVAGLRLESASPEGGCQLFVVQVVGDLDNAVVNDCVHVVLKVGRVLLNPGAVHDFLRARNGCRGRHGRRGVCGRLLVARVVRRGGLSGLSRGRVNRRVIRGINRRLNSGAVIAGGGNGTRLDGFKSCGVNNRTCRGVIRCGCARGEGERAE